MMPSEPARSNSAESLELLALLTETERRTSRKRLWSYYPETGPLRRELYPRHLEFFRLGAVHKERLMLGGNRSGKSTAGAFEVALHLTGLYDAVPWWNGKRFDGPTSWIVAGDTARTTRDILQEKLIGPPGNQYAQGTGMIPGDYIERTVAKAGVPDAIENAHIKHVSGDLSLLQFRSYDQGREIFQGTSQHGIWIDEEVDISIYTEALMRTMTTDGIVLATLTPLSGITQLIQAFLPEYAPGV